MSELAQHTTDYGVVEREPASTVERNLSIGSRLWSSALVFFFFAFLFAYFYLRSLNEHGMFKPKGVHAPQGWGIAIVVCLALSAASLYLGAADQRADRRPAWRLKGLGALVLGLAAVVLQIIAWASIGFGPTDGGYASVYLGWTGLYTIFVVGTLYWLETCLALSYRYRDEPFARAQVEPGDASGDPYRDAHDIENPVHLNTAEVAALAFTWSTLVAIGVVTWFVLYIV
jgi:heme/copper-type cytochrome/quinol oxidase subunit 3